MVTEISDASTFRGCADEVFTPRDEEELVRILTRGEPVTVMGALTGVTGGGVPLSGSAISMTRMNRIEIQPGRAIVGPGALLRDVQAAAARSGQFYAPDPTENTASIGGNIACNASGSRSYRFGSTRDYVTGLRVALLDGRVMEVRRGDPVDFDVAAIRVPHTTKFSCGYRLAPGMDFVDLFVGSEGTLGVVTQAELKLLPAPGELTGGVVFFRSEEAAIEAVERWRGVRELRMIEYFDAASLRMMEVQQNAALMIELEGDCDLDLRGASEEESWFAISPADRERLREFRHTLPERVNSRIRASGFLKLSTDYAVPLEKNREMIANYRRMIDLDYVLFGHVGDAHLHVNTFSSSPAEFARAKALMTELARAAVELGGTVGAEHGLGKRKTALLGVQYSGGEITAMRQVKRRFDPEWRLGRGTLFENEANKAG